MDNAYYKAYTAASLTLARKEDSTKAIADRMAKAAPSTVPQTPLPNVTYAQGGVAIMTGGTTIGAIGVSGAPGGQFDEECARAALAKIRTAGRPDSSRWSARSPRARCPVGYSRFGACRGTPRLW